MTDCDLCDGIGHIPRHIETDDGLVSIKGICPECGDEEEDET